MQTGPVVLGSVKLSPHELPRELFSAEYSVLEMTPLEPTTTQFAV